MLTIGCCVPRALDDRGHVQAPRLKALDGDTALCSDLDRPAAEAHEAPHGIQLGRDETGRRVIWMSRDDGEGAASRIAIAPGTVHLAAAGDPTVGPSLKTPVIVSTFTDRLASPDDALPRPARIAHHRAHRPLPREAHRSAPTTSDGPNANSTP